MWRADTRSCISLSDGSYESPLTLGIDTSIDNDVGIWGAKMEGVIGTLVGPDTTGTKRGTSAWSCSFISANSSSAS